MSRQPGAHYNDQRTLQVRPTWASGTRETGPASSRAGWTGDSLPRSINMGAGEPWGWGVSILGRESGRGGAALCPPGLWGLQPGVAGGAVLASGLLPASPPPLLPPASGSHRLGLCCQGPRVSPCALSSPREQPGPQRVVSSIAEFAKERGQMKPRAWEGKTLASGHFF